MIGGALDLVLREPQELGSAVRKTGRQIQAPAGLRTRAARHDASHQIGHGRLHPSEHITVVPPSAAPTGPSKAGRRARLRHGRSHAATVVPGTETLPPRKGCMERMARKSPAETAEPVRRRGDQPPWHYHDTSGGRRSPKSTQAEWLARLHALRHVTTACPARSATGTSCSLGCGSALAASAMQSRRSWGGGGPGCG